MPSPTPTNLIPSLFSSFFLLLTDSRHVTLAHTHTQILTFSCCRSRLVGATTSLGTEFFFEDLVFGLAPVCRLLLLLLLWLFDPGAIFSDDDHQDTAYYEKRGQNFPEWKSLMNEPPSLSDGRHVGKGKRGVHFLAKLKIPISTPKFTFSSETTLSPWRTSLTAPQTTRFATLDASFAPDFWMKIFPHSTARRRSDPVSMFDWFSRFGWNRNRPKPARKGRAHAHSEATSDGGEVAECLCFCRFCTRTEVNKGGVFVERWANSLSSLAVCVLITLK